MTRVLIPAGMALALVVGVVVLRPDSPRSTGDASPDGVARQGAISRGSEGNVRSHVEALPEAMTAFPSRAHDISAMPPGTEREGAVRDLAGEWAAHSPVEAERWAASLKNPAEREQALTHVCLEAASRDPEDAMEMAGWHRLGDGVVEAVASRWAAADFPGAATWAAALPEGVTRDRILSRVALSRADADPEQAAQLVSDAFTSSEIQQEAAIAVIHRWSLVDPEAAAEWVALFPPGPFQERAEQEIQGAAAYRTAHGEN